LFAFKDLWIVSCCGRDGRHVMGSSWHLHAEDKSTSWLINQLVLIRAVLSSIIYKWATIQVSLWRTCWVVRDRAGLAASCVLSGGRIGISWDK